VDEGDLWRTFLPVGCGEHATTRNVFTAKPGHVLVACDLSAAKPRYLALLFQRALLLRDGPRGGRRAELHPERMSRYPTLLKRMEMIYLREVRTLWNRPRRINGYYQLACPNPLSICFYQMRPVPRRYVARIIPLGSTVQGVQAFGQECWVELDEGRRGSSPGRQPGWHPAAHLAGRPLRSGAPLQLNRTMQ
jgi:hypothetical protein